MRKVLVVLLAVAFAAVGLAAQEKVAGQAKEKKAAAAKQDRWSGYIVRQSKEKSTLTVRKGNVERTVVYNSATKWTRRNKPADASEFKDESRVICVGKFDKKGQLIASRIDLREAK